MRRGLIPRKHRKYVIAAIDEFENGIGKYGTPYKDWEQFLLYKNIGTLDGWMNTNDKEYQALRWLRGINSFIRKMNYYNNDSEEGGK